MISPKVLSAPAFLLAGVFSVSLTGCTLANTAAPGPMPGTALAGNVHGGQQPVSGARIYLLAANPSGYGGPSLSLLTSALTGNAADSIGAYTTTSSAGMFDVTGDYSCTLGYSQGASTTTGGTVLPGNEQVYLYVAGGNPGLGTGANTGIGLLAALGPCNSQVASTISINEITTVAAAYAFAGYATDATHLASSGSPLALTGLANAGLNAQSLANVFTGTVPSTTPGRNGFLPTANIATIANILAACVNSASGSPACTTLFGYTRTSGSTGTAPTETASAAIHLAQNPFPSSAGMAALYGLSSSTPPFSGALTAQPNDFTLGINFSGGGFANGTGAALAIDAAGNAWSTSGPRLCKFSSTGAAISPASGYTGAGLQGAKEIAIDIFGNIWAPSFGNNNLAEYSSSGVPLSGSSGYSGAAGGISTPLGVAIDASNNVWIANQSGSLSKFSSAGTPVSPSTGYTDASTLVSFYGVAIDTAGNAWAANYSNSSFSKFSNTGVALSPANGYYGGGLSNPYAIAIDPTGNIWAPNYYSSTVSKFSASGGALSGPGGYQAGGINSPESIAIDSAGVAWVGNFNGNTVTALSNNGVALSPSPAYNSGSGIYGPVSVAVDGSGDVWVTNYSGSLTELIGAASPVVTPIVANLLPPYGASTVNRP